MPFLFRRSDDKRSWDPRPWVPRGDIPAAPFADLKPTPTSQLSVWLIFNDRSNLNRIVAALAAGRNHLDKFDYVLLDDAKVTHLQIEIEAKEERCADEEASALWHRNMLRLTGSQLHEVVREAYAAQRVGRVLEPDVEGLIRAGLGEGRLNRQLVHGKILEALGL